MFDDDKFYAYDKLSEGSNTFVEDDRS